MTFMKGMIKVGRWANEHKRAAAAILDKQTFYLDVEHTYEGIKHIDMVPNLSPQNLVSVEIGKDFMLSHGYIKNDFDVQKWAAPEFLEQAARELLEEEWRRKPPRSFRRRLRRWPQNNSWVDRRARSGARSRFVCLQGKSRCHVSSCLKTQTTARTEEVNMTEPNANIPTGNRRRSDST